MPKIHFDIGKEHYYKYYTRFFGKDRRAAPALVLAGLMGYEDWEQDIDAWQTPVLNDPVLPDWYKSALFNESYFVSDGGSVWLNIEEQELKNFAENDPRLV